MPTRQIRVPQLLTPIGSGALAGSVARQISDAIHLGLIGSGEQLPSEGDLAHHMAVSAMTLREALAILREQGLVETRRGRNGGSFVCAPRSPAVSTLRARLEAMSATEIRDLGDEQLAIAGTSAQLAAQRAAEGNLRQLQKFAAELRAARTIGARSRANSLYWIEVSLATQSERLTHAAMRLQVAMGELLWLSEPRALDQHEAAAALADIAAAIAEEDGALARSQAEAFTDRTTRWLISTHLDLTRRPR